MLCSVRSAHVAIAKYFKDQLSPASADVVADLQI